MESMGYYEKYNPTHYNFINPTGDDKTFGVVNITRGDLFKWLAKNYPNHINNLVKLLMVEILYYNKIVNEDYGPDLPKVKKLLPIHKTLI
jgi:hypothetical protein